LGIKPLVENGWAIYRANKNRTWPTSSAGTNIAILWLVKGVIDVRVTLDGNSVSAINSMLHDGESNLIKPHELIRNSFVSKGSDFLGEGFLLDEHEADGLVADDGKLNDVIFLFINGEVLNSYPSRRGPRRIIDFRERSESEAQEYAKAWKLVEERVKPKRLEKDPNKYPRMVFEWWKHWNSRPELYIRTKDLETVIVLSIVSKYMIPAVVPSAQVFGAALVVWPTEDFAFFALVSSTLHRYWAQLWGSKMRNDFRYVLSDCYNTFPFPESSPELESMGRELDQMQRQIADKYSIGLTKIYSEFHSENVTTPEILKLRKLHQKIDFEILKLYDFEEIADDYEVSEFEGLNQWGPHSRHRQRLMQFLLLENQRQNANGVREWGS